MKRVKHVLVLMLTLAACCSHAQEVERVDLSYLIEKSANGFWEIRGDARGDSTHWHSRVLLSGAKDCYIDWTKRPPQTNTSFHCLMLTSRDASEARRLYLRLIDLAVGTEPGWKQVHEAPPHEDNFRSIAEFTPRGTVNRMVDVAYDKETSGGDAGKYSVTIVVWSGVSVDQAEEAVQERARAEASARQNVCISDDLTKEWRNPPAGGKMESFKRLLIQSLRERAKTSGYDQTRWIAVDSRYYSAWPNTSWGNLVSTIPGGSCGAAGHREILALAP